MIDYNRGNGNKYLAPKENWHKLKEAQSFCSEIDYRLVGGSFFPLNRSSEAIDRWVCVIFDGPETWRITYAFPLIDLTLPAFSDLHALLPCLGIACAPGWFGVVHEQGRNNRCLFSSSILRLGNNTPCQALDVGIEEQHEYTFFHSHTLLTL